MTEYFTRGALGEGAGEKAGMPITEGFSSTAAGTRRGRIRSVHAGVGPTLSGFVSVLERGLAEGGGETSRR